MIIDVGEENVKTEILAKDTKAKMKTMKFNN